MIDVLRVLSKHAFFLWLSGFREACSLHRAFFFCKRSRKLAIRTGQCFILNGLIFLGSILLLNSVIKPILFSILPHDCRQLSSSVPCDFQRTLKLYAFLRSLLIEIFYVLWFYPLYLFSFIISSLWYNDIAQQAFLVMEDTSHAKEHPSGSSTSTTAFVDKREGFEGFVIGLAEQIYSVLLLIFFFIEVSLVGLLPYIGVPAKFILLSWMYSYYCFEYKWNLADFGCKERLELFHTNWAFFAGSPCALAIFFFSPLVSGGVMAILFPLFVLSATGTQERQLILSHGKMMGSREPVKIPVFYAVDILATWTLRHFFSATSHGKSDDKAH
ncbi:protein EI24 homolog isoform X2 [Nymphaea colorata]|uniref:protein EI24 homolog isoform X2 n=1 Tax=Nymphaea colorata TaxID=210225 RepID=UPI00129EB631|nr:protein EI24 homolog isoform X2 [Nymphaea colorata]